MQTSENLRAYFNRVTDAVPELYNMAYAICGNYDQALYSLQYALMEGWFGENHGGMGFREGLRNTVRQVACEEALGKGGDQEFTWNGLAGESDDPVAILLAGESLETRRAAALRFGCGLSLGRTARLMKLPAGKVRAILNRLERSAARNLSEGRPDRLPRTVRRLFLKPDPSMPPMSAIYRSFESEAAENRRPSHLAAKIARRVILTILALLCALAFWLMAVLIRPPSLEGEEHSMQKSQITVEYSSELFKDLT